MHEKTISNFCLCQNNKQNTENNSQLKFCILVRPSNIFFKDKFQEVGFDKKNEGTAFGGGVQTYVGVIFHIQIYDQEAQKPPGVNFIEFYSFRKKTFFTTRLYR